MMKLTDYKERDIPGWHEPNVTTETILRYKGRVVGAYFPVTTPTISFLIDYIIEGCRGSTKSFIPHIYGGAKLESIFFGALRTDGSLGRHKATLAAYHQSERNIDILIAISILGELGVRFAASKDAELADILEKQKRQQRLLCDGNICITDHFTSGSINYNGILYMHYDIASLPNVLNLIFYKRDGMGGNLVLPELDACIDCKSYSMVLLCVRDIMHGVSAFDGKHRDSIIYYCVNGTG